MRKLFALKIISIILIFGMIYAIGLFSGWFPGIETCMHRTLAEPYKFGGMEFSFEETNCDGFGNSTDVSVYVHDSEHLGKTLLFKYGPWNDSYFPKVEVVDDKTIIIHIERIADVISQLNNWNHRVIKYDIKKIQYQK
jgi:hypothetical protein